MGGRAVGQALESGGFDAAGDDVIADALQGIQPLIAAVLDDELETAGGAEAVDRGRAEGRNDGAAGFTLVDIQAGVRWRSIEGAVDVLNAFNEAWREG